MGEGDPPFVHAGHPLPIGHGKVVVDGASEGRGHAPHGGIPMGRRHDEDGPRRLGQRLEEEYGTREFVLIYLFGGVFANLFRLSVQAAGLAAPSIATGASGAIMGLLVLYAFHWPYQRVLFGQAIRWAAGDSPRIEVLAPLCIQTTFFEQSVDGRKRLVLHIFNGVNTAAL